MSVININYKQSERKAQELKELLLDIDRVCDILYNRLDYEGVWETILCLEDVRVQYYVEWFEHEMIVQTKGKNNV